MNLIERTKRQGRSLKHHSYLPPPPASGSRPAREITETQAVRQRLRQEAFDRIEAAASFLREPKQVLGAVFERDAAEAGGLDKLSRHEGMLRKRRDQTLQRLEHLQARDAAEPSSDTGKEQ